jgi:hypothetical protein
MGLGRQSVPILDLCYRRFGYSKMFGLIHLGRAPAHALVVALCNARERGCADRSSPAPIQ